MKIEASSLLRGSPLPTGEVHGDRQALWDGPSVLFQDHVMADIYARRVEELKPQALVQRQEARKLDRILDEAAKGLSEVKEKSKKLAALSSVGMAEGLFPEVRRSYHSDLASLRQDLQKTLREAFADYETYQSYYGWGEQITEGGKDWRSPALRLAIQPLALSFQEALTTVDHQLQGLSATSRIGSQGSPCPDWPTPAPA